MQNTLRGSRVGRADLILLAGVPGAGKSTALRKLARRRPDLTRIDSDDPRRLLADLLGPRIGYRWYRPVVHLIHALRATAAILTGPRPRHTLVVHHPGTAGAFRGSVARLGRLRGWVPAVVFLDTGRERALAGQRERGRVVRGRSFDRHWQRWQVLRRGLDEPSSVLGREPWSQVHLGTRADVVALIDALTTVGVPAQARLTGAGGQRPRSTAARGLTTRRTGAVVPQRICDRLPGTGSLPKC